MKWTRMVITLLLLLAAALGAQAQDDMAQGELPDLGGQEITVAVENAYPPFNFYDEDGNAVGWDYDVINEICNRINCVPTYIETAWDGMILAVSNGEYDMAADGITITEERAEIVDFSLGYVSLEQALLVRADEDRFSSVEEFVEGDYSLGVQPGTTNYFVGEELVGADRLVTYETFPIAVQAMIAGDVDAVIMDDVAGQGYVGANPDAVMILGEPLTAGEELGFIFPPGSELREAINAGLQSMMDDYTLNLINNRWFISQELPDLGGQEITVAVENAYPPFNFYDDEGNAIGWDYDTIGELCERLNCVPNYVETAWDGMILAVSNGEYDMAADGITITEERAEIVDFSVGYVSLEQALLVRADEDRFSSVEEFVEGDYSLGVQPGTTNYFVGEELVGADRLVTYETFPIAVQAMISGDVDAVIMDNVAGQGYVGANPDAVRILGDALAGTEELGFIFPPGSELREAVNLGLAQMRLDGTLATINNRWFLGTEE